VVNNWRAGWNKTWVHAKTRLEILIYSQVRNVKSRGGFVGPDIFVDSTKGPVSDEILVANCDRGRTANRMRQHLPPLGTATVQFERTSEAKTHIAEHGHYAPKPFHVVSPLARGLLEIVDTPDGERMRPTVTRHVEGLQAEVTIRRPGNVLEALPLLASPEDHHILQSAIAPSEPHEFEATLNLADPRGNNEALPFAVKEPAGHHHSRVSKW
jgi:hypothetical protein